MRRPPLRIASLALVASLLVPPGVGAQSSAARSIPGAARIVLDSTVIRASGARTLVELLSGRVPGLAVTFTSGIPGSAPAIHARGAESLFGALAPALYVDGLRVDEDRYLLDQPMESQRPSFAWDLPVEEIARVEVLLGAAATTMLDYATPRGAVLVTTLRPDANAPTRAVVELVTLGPLDAYPANYGTQSATYPGNPRQCTLSRQAGGACVATTTEQWNPLGAVSPYENSMATRATLSGGGALLGGAYRIAGHAVSAPSALDGVLGPSRLGGVASFARTLPRDIDLDVNLGYARTTADFGRWRYYPARGLRGNSSDDATRGYQFEAPAIYNQVRAVNTAERSYASARGAITPRDGLRIDARLAWDRSQRTLFDHYPAVGVNPAIESSSRSRSDGLTLSTGASYTHAIAAGVGGTSTLRGTHRRAWFDEDAPGAVVFGEERITIVVAREALSWGDHRSLGVSLRAESWGAGENALRSGALPGIDAAWAVSEEAFFPPNRVFNGLTIRAAVGRAIDFPQHAAYFAPGVCLVCTPRPGFERTHEVEFGADANLFGDRATLAVTTWKRTTTSALIRVPISASSGFTSRIAHLGTWVATGTDLRLELAPITSNGVTFRGAATLGLPSHGAMKVPILPTFDLLDAESGYVGFRFGSNLPFGDLWGTRYTYADVNLDGLIDSSEVSSTGQLENLGRSLPTRVIGIQGSLAVAGVEFGISVDGQGGHVKYNASEAYRCQRQTCRALHDPDASLDAQARAVALAYHNAVEGFVEDASFVRIRELWVRFPVRWLAGRSGRAPSLVVSGRNLFTSTAYRGVDPEAAAYTGPGLNAGERYAHPIQPSFSARLEIGW